MAERCSKLLYIIENSNNNTTMTSIKRMIKKWHTLTFSVFFFTVSGIMAQNIQILVLGIAQDAGYPQANCTKSCCIPVWEGYAEPKMVTSLGIIDHQSGKTYLLDCTPDFKNQLSLLQHFSASPGKLPDAIFLTHAHIGHYTGLMELGHEVIGASDMPVYAMPRMENFLRENGPWSQLVDYNNIELRKLLDQEPVQLSSDLTITPFLVPHRDEFSETVGYRISTSSQSILFIPDINKWDLWEENIIAMVRTVDYALLDATFYENGEIPGRDMSQIPHPFVQETMEKFRNEPDNEKSKIYFIHLNHTNPLMDEYSQATQNVLANGFKIAYEGMVIPMKGE